jgi:hypothetical protein
MKKVYPGCQDGALVTDRCSKLISAPITSEVVGSIPGQTHSLYDREGDSNWQCRFPPGAPVSSYIHYKSPNIVYGASWRSSLNSMFFIPSNWNMGSISLKLARPQTEINILTTGGYNTTLLCLPHLRFGHVIPNWIFLSCSLAWFHLGHLQSLSLLTATQWRMVTSVTKGRT